MRIKMVYAASIKRLVGFKFRNRLIMSFCYWQSKEKLSNNFFQIKEPTTDGKDGTQTVLFRNFCLPVTAKGKKQLATDKKD